MQTRTKDICSGSLIHFKGFARASFAFVILLAPFQANGLYAQENNSDFSKIVSENFKSWDLNHDGILSGSEIDGAILNPKNKGRVAAALAALRTAERKTKNNSGSAGLSAEAINDMGSSNSKSQKLLGAYAKAEKKLGQENSALFAPGAPHLETMHQGKTGDCYFISSVGSMVSNRPEQLKSMIEEKNGDFVVHFFGQAVRISRPTDGEFATFGSTNKDGMWLNVLEKAYATLKLKPDEDEDDMYAGISGGHAAPVIKLLTGHNTRRFLFKKEEGRSRGPQAVSRALRDHRLVVTGIRTQKENGKSSGHALAVVDINLNHGQVTIWNPYGSTAEYKGYMMKNGLFTIPIQDWLSKFSGTTVEEPDGESGQRRFRR